MIISFYHIIICRLFAVVIGSHFGRHIENFITSKCIYLDLEKSRAMKTYSKMILKNISNVLYHQTKLFLFILFYRVQKLDVVGMRKRRSDPWFSFATFKKLVIC